MEVVEKKWGNGVEWVVMGTVEERARYAERNTRSLDCAESFAIANDSVSLGMTKGGDGSQNPHPVPPKGGGTSEVERNAIRGKTST